MYPIYFIYIMVGHVIKNMFNLYSTRRFGVHWLKQIEKEFKGQFDQQIFNKVAKYQSIQLHLVNEVFTNLFKRKITTEEKVLNIKYFLMTALYDQLLDEQKINETALNNLFFHPDQSNPENFNEKVLVELHLSLLNCVSNKEAYWEIIRQVHLAQIDSLKQFNSSIEMTDIENITIRKGGYSLLMCRHFLKDQMSVEVDACWFEIGALIQMTNDLYDTYKDSKEGISTFANRIDSIDEIAKIYNKQKQHFLSKIKGLPMNSSAKRKFCIQTAVISAFGDIALAQLKRRKNTFPIKDNLAIINRSNLIIDMEHPLNVLRLLYYTYKNGKLWT
jgi:hypothetical protein